MTIRKATTEDIHPVTQLFEAYRAFYRQAPDYDTARSFLLERLRNEESVIYLAEDPGAIGFVQLYPIFSSTRMKRLWLLNDLYVDLPFRGKGYSVLLLEAAKAHCEATHACGLILETAKTNAVGNRLYPRAGFLLDGAHNYYSWEPVDQS